MGADQNLAGAERLGSASAHHGPSPLGEMENIDPSLLVLGADHLRLFFRGYQGFFSLGFLGQEKATELMEEKATELVEDRLGETALGCRHLPCLDCRHLSFLGHLDAVPYLDHLEADQ